MPLPDLIIKIGHVLNDNDQQPEVLTIGLVI